MTMGERIKQLRKEKGMTQTELAMTLHVTKGTVSTWETNSRVPGFETLNVLSDLFEKRLDYIMGRSDDATPTTRSEDDPAALVLSQMDADLTEYALKYARLDQYGRDAVEAIIRAEYHRCRCENTLFPATACSGHISIGRKDTEEQKR